MEPDTPRTDRQAGWAIAGHYGPSTSSDLYLDPKGPFVHAMLARELERENAKMRGMEKALRMAADALESDCDGDRRRAWNTIRDILEPNAAGRPRDTCRGCAMSHQEATFNADVESGRTIPGLD